MFHVMFLIEILLRSTFEHYIEIDYTCINIYDNDESNIIYQTCDMSVGDISLQC